MPTCDNLFPERWRRTNIIAEKPKNSAAASFSIHNADCQKYGDNINGANARTLSNGLVIDIANHTATAARPAANKEATNCVPDSVRCSGPEIAATIRW